MAGTGLELDGVLKATPWNKAKIMLDANAQAMINAGHWGVPLMVYRDEPFYGQDRFDKIPWRMRCERE
jgi:2-hydroxychromene-2-carboxylate isomerase